MKVGMAFRERSHLKVIPGVFLVEGGAMCAKRVLIVVAVGLGLLGLSASSVAAVKYIRNTMGEAVVGTITARLVGVEDSKWWVGCTVKRGSKEIDLSPKLANYDGQYHWMYGRKFNKYWVSLFEKKVSKRACKKRNGKYCKWCKKNGFHLEGQLDSTGWVAGAYVAATKK